MNTKLSFTDKYSQVAQQLERFGFAEIRNWLPQELHADLKKEALSQLSEAHSSCSDIVDTSGVFISDFGPAAIDYLHSTRIRRLITCLFGKEYYLDRKTSCYTYYLDGGFVAPHRDVVGELDAVTTLTYLITSGDSNDERSGLALDIYDGGSKGPGRKVRRIKTDECTILIGRGCDIWHGRSPLRVNERLAMINGIYFSSNS